VPQAVPAALSLVKMLVSFRKKYPAAAEYFSLFFQFTSWDVGRHFKTNCAICDRNIEARGWKAKGLLIDRVAS